MYFYEKTIFCNFGRRNYDDSLQKRRNKRNEREYFSTFKKKDTVIDGFKRELYLNLPWLKNI